MDKNECVQLEVSGRLCVGSFLAAFLISADWLQSPCRFPGKACGKCTVLPLRKLRKEPSPVPRIVRSVWSFATRVGTGESPYARRPKGKFTRLIIGSSICVHLPVLGCLFSTSQRCDCSFKNYQVINGFFYSNLW